MQNAEWLWSLAIRVRKLRESDFIFGLYTAKTDQKLDSLSFLTLRAFSVLQNTPAAMTDMPVLKAAMLWYLPPFKKLNLFFFTPIEFPKNGPVLLFIFNHWNCFVSCCRLLQMTRMDMDWNLKRLDHLFKFYSETHKTVNTKNIYRNYVTVLCGNSQ